MGHILRIIGALLLALVTRHLYQSYQKYLTKQSWASKHGCKDPPSYPHKDPILGLDLYLSSIRNAQNHRMVFGWLDRYKQFGTTFHGISIGRRNVFTVDPRNLQTVHALDFEKFGVQDIRRDATLPFMGEGVFTMDGVFWERSRALLRPTFTRGNVANLPAFEGKFGKFLRLLPGEGEMVDLKPLLYRLFLDTSTEFLFGESMNTLDPETPFQTREFLKAFHYAQQGMGKRIQLHALRFLHRDRKWWDSIKIAHAFAEKYVDKALEFRKVYLASQAAQKTNGEEKEKENDEDDKRYILLQEMAKETDNRDDLRNQIIHVFVAGHDSSAITIGHSLFYLCRHPEKWEKLHREVEQSGGNFTFESLKNLYYLQYVVKETLRLHPVAPLDSRRAKQDTMLPTGGGPNGDSPIFIPKDSTVTTSFHALHHLAPCFQPDPEAFRPERWETVRPGWEYLPFGGGPRICPGRQLALTEVAYVIARMAQEFRRVECRDPVEEWVEEFKITASSRNGTKVGLYRE